MTYQYHLAIHTVLFKLDEIEPQQFPWHDHTKKCTIIALIVTIVALLVTKSFLTLGILAGGGTGAVLIAYCIKRALSHLLPVNYNRPPITRYPGSKHPEDGKDINVE